MRDRSFFPQFGFYLWTEWQDFHEILSQMYTWTRKFTSNFTSNLDLESDQDLNRLGGGMRWTQPYTCLHWSEWNDTWITWFTLIKFSARAIFLRKRHTKLARIRWKTRRPSLPSMERAESCFPNMKSNQTIEQAVIWLQLHLPGAPYCNMTAAAAEPFHQLR